MTRAAEGSNPSAPATRKLKMRYHRIEYTDATGNVKCVDVCDNHFGHCVGQDINKNGGALRSIHIYDEEDDVKCYICNPSKP